jgi:hypothetical protein
LLRVRTFTDGSGIVAYNIGVLRTFKTFLKDESGATAIEYGLIAAGIAPRSFLWSSGSAPVSRPPSPPFRLA